MTDIKDLIQPDRGQDATSIHLVNADGFEEFAKSLTAGQRTQLAGQKFTGELFQTAIVGDGDGYFAVGGVGNPEKLKTWSLAALAEQLPEGTYRLANADSGSAKFGWLTAQYRFTRYKDDKKATGPRILLTKEVAKVDAIVAEAKAEMLVRDLVNTSAEDMGPGSHSGKDTCFDFSLMVTVMVTSSAVCFHAQYFAPDRMVWYFVPDRMGTRSLRCIRAGFSMHYCAGHDT